MILHDPIRAARIIDEIRRLCRVGVVEKTERARGDCPECGEPVFGNIGRVYCSPACKRAVAARNQTIKRRKYGRGKKTGGEE